MPPPKHPARFLPVENLRCRSSVTEHISAKDEAVGEIPTGSTNLWQGQVATFRSHDPEAPATILWNIVPRGTFRGISSKEERVVYTDRTRERYLHPLPFLREEKVSLLRILGMSDDQFLVAVLRTLFDKATEREKLILIEELLKDQKRLDQYLHYRKRLYTLPLKHRK